MTSTHTSEKYPRRATIEDVAAGAGVSVATVSRALRNLPNVAESTRQRVADVAVELAYQPDPAAARLAAGRTGTVTVAVPSLNGWYFSTVVAGAEAVCADAGLEFQVIGISSAAQRDRLLDEEHRIERRTDGLIMVDITVDDDQATSLRRRGVEFTTIGSRTNGHPSVAIDNELVGRIAGEHLAGLGHQRIGVIGGTADGSLPFDAPIARQRGFVAALSERDVVLADDRFANGRFSVTGGHEAMSSLLEADTGVSAVFAMSDEMAFGALMALDEHALTPGLDLSIVGVDDHEFAQVVDLTTVHQPVADHGSTAARLLVDALARSDQGVPAKESGSTVTSDLQPVVHLVVRSTTGPPRSGS